MRIDTPELGPEHECRQHRRCRARTRTADDQWHGAGVEKPDSLCRPCENHAFAAIRQLGDDYNHLLAARTEPRSRVSGPKVSGTGERSIPIPLAVDALMEAIDNELLRWTVRITHGDPLPAHAQERVHRCVAVLGASLGTLVDKPVTVVPALLPHPQGGDYVGREALDGVDAVLRLAGFHERTIKLLGLQEPAEEYLPESCHVCGLHLVFASLAESLVRCRGCRNCWDQDEFMRLNNPLLAAA